MNKDDYKIIAKAIRDMRGKLPVDEFMFVMQTFTRILKQNYHGFDEARFQNFILR